MNFIKIEFYYNVRNLVITIIILKDVKITNDWKIVDELGELSYNSEVFYIWIYNS